MANIHRHILIHTLTDVLGERFLYGKAGTQKAALSGKPARRDGEAYAGRRNSHQDLLREATTYANFAQTQEVYINQARRTDVTPYYIALMDWFEGPKVLEIDVDAWTGEPGETIRVKTRDNVKVTKVSVVICDADENVLEMGEAVQSETDSAWWRYTTTSRINIEPFPMVEAVAQDLPGNQDSFVIT